MYKELGANRPALKMHGAFSTHLASFSDMSADDFVKLIEEMVDLKVQQHTESRMKAAPEVARVLREKREVDRLRLEQIRTELVQLLTG